MSSGYVWKTLWEGFIITLRLFGWTIIFSTLLGLVFTLWNYVKFKPAVWVLRGIVLVVRGTPLLLQLVIVYYGLTVYGIYLEMMTAAVICFSVTNAVFFSEIFRSSIDSVSKGQREACKVLGLSAFWGFTLVILPQAFKRSLGPMGNVWHTLAKDTALARVIGIIEITRAAQNMVSASTMIYPLLWAGVFYLIFSAVITLAFKLGERRLGYYD